MISILDLKDIHRDCPAAVLGGGPSLPGDLAQIPPGAILISVNHHSLRLLQANYLVFVDKPERDIAMLEAVHGFLPGLRVSPLSRWSDVDLTGADWWRGTSSSHLATWLACWMGCNPVLLCGMDLYQGKRKYFYDRPEFRLTASQVAPAGPQIRAWRKALEKCPHPGRIKAISGLLESVFGKYQA